MKKKTCTGLIQACIYMMRPEIITGTFSNGALTRLLFSVATSLSTSPPAVNKDTFPH